MPSNPDIDNRFDFHAATTEEKRMEHTSVRTACKTLAVKLDQDLPAGREKSLAITKLEEAMFWANAAIARNNERQQPATWTIHVDDPEKARRKFENIRKVNLVTTYHR
ncbi:hypothetical protein ACFXG4_23635 [Nocardia sp. NPDC059246]|uniref:Acb2/Tad1 domain-containing protein n=1 Tax=unclassified Nocardia TaxID=2637762 RepID=UPI0036A86219